LSPDGMDLNADSAVSMSAQRFQSGVYGMARSRTDGIRSVAHNASILPLIRDSLDISTGMGYTSFSPAKSVKRRIRPGASSKSTRVAGQRQRRLLRPATESQGSICRKEVDVDEFAATCRAAHLSRSRSWAAVRSKVFSYSSPHSSRRTGEIQDHRFCQGRPRQRCALAGWDET
jgi:hypothetical protein